MMVILVKQSIAYIFDQKNRPNRKLKKVKPEVIKLKQVKIMFVLMKNLNILK